MIPAHITTGVHQAATLPKDLKGMRYFTNDTRIYDPNKVAHRASQLLPNVQIETFANAGHGLVFQYSEAIAGRVLAFIQGESKATP
jgi:hypothetical protein